MLASPDGCTDAPAVCKVVAAEQPDGGSLGEGWWLSRERMKKVGTRLTDLEISLARTEHERDEALATSAPIVLHWSFWAGVAVGGVTAVVAVYAVDKVLGR